MEGVIKGGGGVVGVGAVPGDSLAGDFKPELRKAALVRGVAETNPIICGLSDGPDPPFSVHSEQEMPRLYLISKDEFNALDSEKSQSQTLELLKTSKTRLLNAGRSRFSIEVFVSSFSSFSFRLLNA